MCIFDFLPQGNVILPLNWTKIHVQYTDFVHFFVSSSFLFFSFCFDIYSLCSNKISCTAVFRHWRKFIFMCYSRFFCVLFCLLHFVLNWECDSFLGKFNKRDKVALNCNLYWKQSVQCTLTHKAVDIMIIWQFVNSMGNAQYSNKLMSRSLRSRN